MIMPLKDGERLDDLHRNGYKIIQHPKGFCFGMDAVLLAAFAKVHKNENHMDFCCGNGVVPILLAARYAGASFYGMEIQEQPAEMAKRSVALNGLCDKISIIHGDIKEAADIFGHGSFDVITVNPPYMPPGSGFENESTEMAIARHELKCNLDDVALAASKALRYGGRLYMVHRPGRLADIICALRDHGLEPKILRFAQPRAGGAPNMLLIMAIRGGKPHLNMEPPLIIYDSKGVYTQEVRELYYE
ncbi:MAG: tRNA1(Val) (adenine(37)-N6)-methyltransferase [Defluviitaleaceae bacterium]|nr:tRNA1(Val) (adenine(37)-N6)-methyltransferase [Defluviitaleaceae bacterium]